MTIKTSIRLSKPQRQSKQNVAKVVRSIVTSMAEIKDYVDISGTVLSLSTGSVRSVSQHIVLGDEINQRTGRQIKLESIDFRMFATLPTASVFGTIRFLLIMDHMSLGAVPAVADILEFASIVSPLNVTAAQAHRYRVIYDHCFPMVAGGNNQEIFHRQVFKPKEKVEYLLPTDVVGANYKNAVYMLVITDVVGLGAPTFSYTMAIKYTDM